MRWKIQGSWLVGVYQTREEAEERAAGFREQNPKGYDYEILPHELVPRVPDRSELARIASALERLAASSERTELRARIFNEGGRWDEAIAKYPPPEVGPDGRDG